MTVEDMREFEKRVLDLEFDDLANYAMHTNKDNGFWLEAEIGTLIMNLVPSFRLDRLLGMINSVCEKINEKDIPDAAKKLREDACMVIRKIIGDEIDEKIADDIESDKE